jgi:carbohydrate kinase (thermoresistant glucokinase family)
VIACSALKRTYRRDLSAGRPEVIVVFLKGSEPLIAARLERRGGHFMPAGLLASQFAALEPPTPDEKPIVVDIDQPVAAQVEDVVAGLVQRGRIEGS